MNAKACLTPAALLGMLLVGASCGSTTQQAASRGPGLGGGVEAPTAAQVLAGLQSFYKQTARPDGSFQPGVDPAYVGMSDSASSDLAPVTYACTIHKTFGWRLPF